MDSADWLASVEHLITSGKIDGEAVILDDCEWTHLRDAWPARTALVARHHNEAQDWHSDHSGCDSRDPRYRQAFRIAMAHHEQEILSSDAIYEEMITREVRRLLGQGYRWRLP